MSVALNMLNVTMKGTRTETVEALRGALKNS